MRTRDEIALLLAEKFKRESARLKSWETETDEKAAISFAMAVVEFVRALLADARYSEAKRIQEKINSKKWNKNRNLAMGIHVVEKYLQERMQATKVMSKAIEKYAIKKEGERPWKPKTHKHKHRSKHGHK